MAQRKRRLPKSKVFVFFAQTFEPFAVKIVNIKHVR